MFDWNDLRLFLAVAQTGSTRAAARGLGLNQTTVARRIEVLERALGLSLFDRTTRGHRLTESGREIAAAAGTMAEGAASVARIADGLTRTLSGTIRITAAEIVFAHIVAPIVAEFRAAHPEVRIEYDSSEGFADLAGGEADVAFRATDRLRDERLIGVKAVEVSWTAYCSRSYARQHGMPASVAELKNHAVVAMSGGVGQRPDALWFMSHADPARVAGVSNTVSNLTGILKAGIGVGALPCFHADRETALLRCFDPPREMLSPIWLVTAPERRQLPRIDAFMRLAILRLRERRAELQK